VSSKHLCATYVRTPFPFQLNLTTV
jgi:hypothetical protein